MSKGLGCDQDMGRGKCGEITFANKIMLCDDCTFKLIEDLAARDKKVVEIVESCKVWRNTFIMKKELINKLEEAFPEK